MVGHVAHGKTTLTHALTGKSTLTHSEELKRGITIRLGYADVTFYKCSTCEDPKCFSTSEKCPNCFGQCEPVRTVSFIDAPGHETLMATVLTGASLMDGAILLVSASEKCPQPQTREHLIALEMVGIKNVVIVQNKIDLVSKERALENYKEIKNFVKGSILENVPVVPVSAQQMINIDVLIRQIESTIPTPQRDSGKNLKMLIARSFDINRPGTEIKRLSGGILGGSILQGMLKVGDQIEVRPGIRSGNKYKSLVAKVEGLKKGSFELDEAGPGGLIGVMTSLDPSLTKSDSLVGNVVGYPGQITRPIDVLNLEISLLKRVVGAEDVGNIMPIRPNEDLMINIGTSRSIGTVTQVRKEKIEMKLKIPIIAEQKERIVVSRAIAGRWRLIGFGKVL